MAEMLCLFLLSLAVSCSPRTLPPAEHRDSIRVEYRERIDTVLVELEIQREVERVIVRDSVSRLENSFAVSEASIDTLGYLHHSLETKAQTIARPVYVTIHDTTYVEREGIREYVEVNRLTEAQSAWIRAGKVLLVITIALVALLLLLAYLRMRM